MEQLAQDYKKQIDKCFYNESDKEQLYEWLRLYKEKLLSVRELASQMRMLIKHPDQLTLFENSRCLIPHEDQEEYDVAIPKYTPRRTRGVLISASPDELVGFSVRGGVEYRTGIYAVLIEPGSAAERCGLVVGDEIVRVNGYSLSSCTHSETVNLIAKHKRMLSLKVRHIGMIPIPATHSGTIPSMFRWIFVNEIDRTSSESSDNDEVFDDLSPLMSPIFNDLRTIFINWEDHPALGCNVVDMKTGIFVSTVKPNTPAHAAGVTAGDEIMEVNGVDFRKAATNEVVFALKNSKQLTMVLRKTDGVRNRTTSRSSLNFSQPETKREIEEKIEKLFESKLAKSAEYLKQQRHSMSDFRYPPVHGLRSKRTSLPDNIPISNPTTSSLKMQDNDPVTSNIGSIVYPAINENKPYTSSQTNIPEIEKAKSGNENGDIIDDFVNDVILSKETPNVRLSGEEPFLKDDEDNVVIPSLPIHFNSRQETSPKKLTILENDDDGNWKVEEHDIQNDTQQEETKDRENRRQKLESELKERLKLERQKRLAQEKALRLDRLRQELKETEREEERLQKWLAREDNLEEQHHTVGSRDYKSANILNNVHPDEYDLTTPPDMRQRNEKTLDTIPKSTSLQNGMSEYIQNLRAKYGYKVKISNISKINVAEFRLRTFLDVGGKKVIISNLNGDLKSQGNMRVGDYVVALDGVELQEAQTSADEIMQKFLRSNNQTLQIVTVPPAPRINPTNEITCF